MRSVVTVISREAQKRGPDPAWEGSGIQEGFLDEVSLSSVWRMDRH